MTAQLRVVSSNTIEDIAKYPLVYLATPYSKYQKGLEAAARDAAKIAAKLMRMGVKVYSPICHTHLIALHGHINPLDHDVWLTFDEAFMDKCDALVVAKMDGWTSSDGIKREIGVFGLAEKPVYYLNIESFEVRR